MKLLHLWKKLSGKTMLIKSIFRTIKSSFGRYMAIFSIIALGVGFFAGLKITESAMHKTADAYLGELGLYDFRLVSTLGFTGEDVDHFQNLDGIHKAYGSVSADVITLAEDGSDAVLHAHTLLEGINGVDLVEGRLPERPDECLLDALYVPKSILGQKLVLSQNNTLKTFDVFSYDEYTVVGLVNASEYINFQRGTTALSGGKATGFIYLLEDGFETDYFTEIYLSLPHKYEIHSTAYKNAIKQATSGVTALLEERADMRYEALCRELQALMDTMPAEMLETNGLSMPEEPATYVLDRSSNLGYVCFENDIQIVSGVAKVFPVFFFLVAALVCITTMTRMVGEHRTQNGVLKALGYQKTAISAQYLIYAGSASALGAVVGFFLGTKLMPMAMWEIYHIMYSIERPIRFVFDGGMFALCLIGYVACILGVTYLVCRRDLKTSAAELMRPAAPTAGKRIFLEYIGFIWRPMKFLHKVSLRNILRYKKRMVMMIIGIGGCTSLLIAGFGIRDTIQPIVDHQYGEINLYDATVSFLDEPTGEQMQVFREEVGDFATDVTFVHSGSVELVTDHTARSVETVAYTADMAAFVHLHSGKNAVAFPEKDQIAVSCGTAKKLGLSVGDAVKLRMSDYTQIDVTVSGIYDNYIGDILYLRAETYEQMPKINTAYLKFESGTDGHQAGAALLNMQNVGAVNIVNDMKEMVGGMLDSLNLIVLIVLLCAGALAFIVLYNLTNITITERIREIATLKVLGFHTKEQKAYVFRENMILTALSAIVGIPCGIALLHYALSQIKVDGFYFGVRLATSSYFWAVGLTLLFTIVVDFVLSGKLKKINMAEAMKAIE